MGTVWGDSGGASGFTTLARVVYFFHGHFGGFCLMWSTLSMPSGPEFDGQKHLLNPIRLTDPSVERMVGRKANVWAKRSVVQA
jgi:hypothetical protein